MGRAQVTWGQVDPSELASIVVVSPHFDDAVMGAGLMLARHADATTAVVTVFAGRPPSYPDPPSAWDALGGFRAGDDVVAVRQAEDRAAMEVLDADAVWLDFPDHQYLAPPDRPKPEQVAPALEEAVAGCAATAVFVPMGLGNPDH